MFRRLFISILILSALTADGVVDFPSLIQNYMCSENGLSLQSEQDLIPVLMNDLQAGNGKSGLYCAALLGKLFRKSLYDVDNHKVKNPAASAGFSASGRYSYSWMSSLEFPLLRKENRNIIFSKSDLSPPVSV